VGSVVASELLARKQPVTVLLRDRAKASDWEARGARVHLCSLLDADSLVPALQRADGFFALQPPSFEPGLLAKQAALAHGVASAVAQAKVPQVVLLSSLGSHLESGTGPIQGLYHFERALRESGTRLTALRSSYFQENVAHALWPARNAGIFVSIAPSPDEAFPRVATKDVGHLAAATLLSPPAESGVVNVLGPAYSNRQVAQRLGIALGKELKLVEVPRQGWVAGLTQSGMLPEHAELYAEMYDALDRGVLVPAEGAEHQGCTPIEQTLQTCIDQPTSR